MQKKPIYETVVTLALSLLFLASGCGSESRHNGFDTASQWLPGDDSNVPSIRVSIRPGDADYEPLEQFPAKLTLFNFDQPLVTATVYQEQDLMAQYPEEITGLYVGNTLIMQPFTGNTYYLDQHGKSLYEPALHLLPRGPACQQEDGFEAFIDLSNLTDYSGFNRLWSSDSGVGLAWESNEHPATVFCSSAEIPSIWMNPLKGEYSLLDSAEIAQLQHSSMPVSDRVYQIPPPQPMPQAEVSVKTNWVADTTSVSLVKTRASREGHYLTSEVSYMQSSSELLAVPYLPSIFGDDQGYTFVVAGSSPINPPFTSNAHKLVTLFGHLDQQYFKEVGRTDEAQLQSGLLVQPLNFPFNDVVEGHGSALLSVDWMAEQLDILVMEFEVEDALHGGSGTIEVLAPISTGNGIPQINVSSLMTILENIAQDITANYVAIRDYHGVSGYHDALSAWTHGDAPYSEVGLNRMQPNQNYTRLFCENFGIQYGSTCENYEALNTK